MNDIIAFTYENANIRATLTEDGNPPLLRQRRSNNPRIQRPKGCSSPPLPWGHETLPHRRQTYFANILSK